MKKRGGRGEGRGVRTKWSKIKKSPKQKNENQGKKAKERLKNSPQARPFTPIARQLIAFRRDLQSWRMMIDDA